MSRAMYSAGTTAPFVAAAGAAMFFVITGSPSKKITVCHVKITGLTLTAVAYVGVAVEKWSTAPTGGTPVLLVKVPYNGDYPAATASLVQVYTAAPTEGVLVGTLHNRRLLGQATTAAAAGQPIPPESFDFGDMVAHHHLRDSGVVLRDQTEALSLAFQAAPASAVTMDLEVDWVEE